jgi:nucleoside-diphosphate-sugar epimerase
MRALVTGATGFIGWHLAERLREEGWHVRALVRPETVGSLPRGVERVMARLSADEIAPALATDEVIFHLAGVTRARDRAAFLAANGAATGEVAKAARRAGARLVYVSSQAAGGPGTREQPRREADIDEPCSHYGESKLAGEKAVRETEGLRWIILRPVAVYGPRDRDFLTLFRLASFGLFPVLGSPATPYMLVHVDDLVSLVVRAATTAAAEHETLFLAHPDVHDAVSLSGAMG